MASQITNNTFHITGDWWTPLWNDQDNMERVSQSLGYNEEFACTQYIQCQLPVKKEKTYSHHSHPVASPGNGSLSWEVSAHFSTLQKWNEVAQIPQ